MGAALSLIIAKIAALPAWFGLLAVAVFVSIWDVIKDAFSWLFDQVLSVAVSAITAIDVTGLTNSALGGWGALPAELLNVMVLIGVGTAIKIITAAIGVRFALQLIPFVRLGS